MKGIFQKLLMGFSFLFVLTLFITSSVYAIPKLEPEPEPWFTITIHIDRASLPRGIEIEEHQYSQEFMFLNQSDTPFYLLDYGRYYPLDQYPPFDLDNTLPANEKPWFKVVKNTVYQYSPGGSNESGNAWNELYMPNDRGAKVSFDYFPAISGVQLYDPRQDNRPDTVKTPATVPFHFKAYYGSNPVTIKGMFVYAFNANYDPHAGTGGTPPSTASQLFSFVSVILFILIPILLIIAFVWLLRKQEFPFGLRVLFYICIFILLLFVLYLGYSFYMSFFGIQLSNFS